MVRFAPVHEYTNYLTNDSKYEGVVVSYKKI